MLDKKGFDLWADGYDKAVGISYEENSYPFAGYREVLDRIYNTVLSRGRPTVLDVGFGTGTLTAKLYEKGCRISGQDFSPRMIELAQAKMPDARLFCGDFSEGLAAPLIKSSYDFILATYSLHHLTDRGKVSFITSALELLNADGEILIGDVAFADRAALERCRASAGGAWDDDEIYFVFDELKKELPGLRFEPVSFCAGVLTLAR